MILIVDGYNVLKKSVGSSASVRERDAFIKAVTRYAHAKKHMIVLVFDGGASSWLETFAPSTHVKVIYVGHGKSADDYIKEYLEAYKHEDIALVSSDRELNRFADKRSIPSLEAHAFMELVEGVVAGNDKNERKGTSALHKVSSTENEALDELMAALEPEMKKEEDDKMPSSKKNMPSKKERFLLKKVKKL